MKDSLLIYVCDVHGQPAEWIRIVPLGRVELRDSRKPFDITPSDLADIIRKFQADKIHLVVDYQHQSLGDGEALAAGWIQDLEARSDGLYSRVKWTAKALQHILDGEFRYYSPVIKLTRPMELKHAALTNTPALKGTALSPLLAAKYGGEAETEIVVLKGPQAGTPAPQQQEEATAMLKKLIEKFGLKPEATEAEVLALVETREQEAVALKTQAAALPGICQALGLKTDANPEQITGAITALKGDQGKLAALKTEVDALKDREVTRDAEAVVEVALKEGKLTPAERDLAIADAKRDPEGFKARLALRPQIVPIGNKLGVLKDGGQSADGEPGPEAPAHQRVAFKAQKLAAEKKIDLGEATAQVLKDNPELSQQWHSGH